MILLAKLWSAKRSRVPDRDKIVVATRSELSTVRTPLETTNFGCVGDQLGNFVLSNSNVMIENEATSCSCRQRLLVPAHDANTCLMSSHASELGSLFNIPDLDFTGAKTNTDVSPISTPLDTADVSVGWGIEKTADCA